MSMMPELIILISAVACVGAAVVLYFNHSNAAAAGIVVISFVACLYGVGQRVSQDTGPNVSGWWKPNNDSGWWKPNTVEADARGDTKKAEEPTAIRRQQVEIVRDEPARLPLSPPTQLNALGFSASSVVISNVTHKTTGRYIEVSGTVTNANEFPIKNLIVKCGDKTYASADVSTVVDKVVPARSDLSIAGVRLGPIRPDMPPTACLIAKFDRAD